jgi:hypothetical protein
MQRPDTSFQDQITAALGDYADEQLQAAGNIQKESDYINGAVAYQQGKAEEDLDMPGNKWALGGHRFMDAQTLSSSLMAAQREDIAQNSYANSPEQFREQYTARMEGILEGKDPETQALVRKQMLDQMPTLVADHTTQHARYMEGENFNSLERSIDVISRDPTATDALISFAQGGEGSASAALSPERRASATVSGVVRAFDGDNPLAFSALKQAGMLGDDLTTDQQNQIRGAQSRFENRRRSEYNEVLFNGEQALMRKVERAEVSPTQAVEELAVLYADHGINMNAADAGAIYNPALNSERSEKMTRGVLLEEAAMRGGEEGANAEAHIINNSLSRTESSGNPFAFRTNKDGREFGGELQFGQARLDDYAAATGSAKVTVREFTDSGKAGQAAANLWHTRDLIKQAKATGAIGSVINGVTVTLSGLVAVAHLGGAAGMRKFVNSNGASSPADELGTSLTNYLRDHGSGEGNEFFTSSERYNNAQGLLANTRERLAMDNFEEMEPRKGEADNQFRNGSITRQEWLAERKQINADYGEARTMADVQRETAVMRGVDEAIFQSREDLAKVAGQEQAVQNIDAANLALMGPRAAYDAVMNSANSTPLDMANATKTLRDERDATYQQFGVPVSKQGNSSANDAMYKQMQDGMTRYTKRQMEDADIGAAINGGYVSDLPKALQRRAFDQMQEQVTTARNTQVASGAVTEEQGNALIASDLNAVYAQTGTVDTRITAKMSAAILGPLIDKEGNPNPAVVDAVEQYAELKAMNPRAAEAFLDPEARNIAEAVITRSGDTGQFAEGTRILGINPAGNPRVDNVDDYMARTDVIRAIDREAKNFLETRDIDVLHAAWQGDADFSQVSDTRRSDSDRLQSDEARANVSEQLSREVAILQRISPNLRPRDLVGLASERLSRRMEVVGGDVITFAQGQDVAKEFFGGRATDMMHDGAINSAITHWMRSDEFQAEHGISMDTEPAERLPWIAQKAGDLALAPLRALGMDMNFTPAMSAEEAMSTGLTGLRPFRSYTGPDGKSVVIEVLMPGGGYSEPIVVPAKKAGEMYMKSRKEANTK